MCNLSLGGLEDFKRCVLPLLKVAMFDIVHFWAIVEENGRVNY